MASYAISSSLILVIHDNMIIGNNHIVLACLCRHFQVPKMPKQRVKTEQEKEKKRHRRMNRRYQFNKRQCNRRTSWYTGETLGTVG
jgi:hypothetical protein